MPDENLVRTSDSSWIEEALRNYRDKKPFRLLDDAGIGIGQEDVASGIRLIAALKRKRKLRWGTLATILIGLGMSSVGLTLLFLAWIDPEPYSKLGALIAAGTVLLLFGGGTTVVALNKRWRVRVKGPIGTEFEIDPNAD